MIGRVIDGLGIGNYAMYVFDYGAPVGFRVALAHDSRVRAVISQNGNAYLDGFGAPWQPIRDAWDDPAAFDTLTSTLATLDGTRGQWLSGVRDPEHVDPEQYRADQAVLDLPGRARYQRDLLWDYRTNPQRFPYWQEWLRRRRPGVLAVWGGRDPWFVPAGAHAFRRDVPDAEVVLVEAATSPSKKSSTG